MTFDTGHNLPLRPGTLNKAWNYLQLFDYDYLSSIKDNIGTYSYLLRYQGGRVYLVARAAWPVKIKGVDYVSSQRALIVKASEEEAPILVCIWPQERARPFFRLFNSVELKENYADKLTEINRDNRRLGSRMLNYEWDLGVDTHPRRLWEIWSNMKKKAPPVKQIRLQIDVPQKMISCQCGTLYSNKLETCPQCGRRPEQKIKVQEVQE